ncbi:uncharacterized protein odam [Scomber japonicus]|uniref:uncharacterized protein odam n=1 Tax=Scomber japonicus TaxID=13676 RepID=UPI002305DF1E|nr:uncharacterized protein odam [Scomber japonicus]
MKLQTSLLLICLFRTSFALPLQIGILASNSNEILGLNGLTLAALGQAQVLGQGQASEVLFIPQVLNLNPQLAGPFIPQGGQLPQFIFPAQGNQLTPGVLPNGQQEQLPSPQDPNNPQQAQIPMQTFPQFQYPAFGYPQFTGQQGLPYFLTPYGYPQQRNNVVLQPNNGKMGQRNPEKTTQRPQLPLQQPSQPKVQTDKVKSTTIPPNPRGDASGPGVDEGQSNFPFLFEP